MFLHQRVKSQWGVSEKEHDFIIGTPMKLTIMVQHLLHEDIDISKSCFFI